MWIERGSDHSPSLVETSDERVEAHACERRVRHAPTSEQRARLVCSETRTRETERRGNIGPPEFWSAGWAFDLPHAEAFRRRL